MKNVDTGNIKNFCELAGKLQESDKKEVMDVIQTLAAMTKEQHRIYDALMEKTILTIPEDDMNRGHSEFISYAAEAVRNGATLEAMLETWAVYSREGKFLPAEEKFTFKESFALRIPRPMLDPGTVISEGDITSSSDSTIAKSSVNGIAAIPSPFAITTETGVPSIFERSFFA